MLKGTYSTVYKCKLTENGPVFAAKVIKLNHSEGAPGTAIREISILKQLKHRNIVRLHKVYYNPGEMIFVLEYIVSSHAWSKINATFFPLS